MSETKMGLGLLANASENVAGSVYNLILSLSVIDASLASASSDSGSGSTYAWYQWLDIVVQAVAGAISFFEYGRMLMRQPETRWWSLRPMILFSCGWLMVCGSLLSIFTPQMGSWSCFASSSVSSVYHTVFHTFVYLLVLYYFWDIYSSHARIPRYQYLWVAIPVITVGLILFCVLGHYLSCKPPNPEESGTVVYGALVLVFFIFFFLTGVGFFYLIRIRLGHIILRKEHHFLSNRFLGVILVYLPFFLGRIVISIVSLVKGEGYSVSGLILSLWFLIVETAPTVALIIAFRFYSSDLQLLDKGFEINYDEEDSPRNSGDFTVPLNINQEQIPSRYSGDSSPSV